MIEIKSAIDKIEEFLRKLKTQKFKTSGKNSKLIKNLKLNFYKELDDDFNTPKAFGAMFEFIKKANQLLEENLISKKEAADIYKFFAEINKIFGIVNFKKITKAIPAQIKKLAKERELARKNQNWQRSDEIRKELEKNGYTVDDTKNGTVIKRF